MLVLLVDNNLDMVMMMRQVLEFEGHDVIVGRGGREALQLLAQTIPDIIISDLLMPDIDGFELLKHVRQTSAWAHLPFIIVSGNVYEAERALEQGADAYIPKPFKVENLRLAMEKAKSQGS
jgi:CheY-like chemotaxis protein